MVVMHKYRVTPTEYEKKAFDNMKLSTRANTVPETALKRASIPA
jgi:hypothetical protein